VDVLAIEAKARGMELHESQCNGWLHRSAALEQTDALENCFRAPIRHRGAQSHPAVCARLALEIVELIVRRALLFQQAGARRLAFGTRRAWNNGSHRRRRLDRVNAPDIRERESRCGELLLELQE
jgi:hypothetical protein